MSAAGLLGLGLGPAMAQEEGESAPFDNPFQPVDELVELPGRCPAAAPIEPGSPVDCFFELLDGVSADELRAVDIIVDGVSRGCRVESELSPVVVCRDALNGRFEQGDVALDLRIEGEIAENAATANLTWATNPQFSIYRVGEGDSVVFDGRPLTWTSYVYEPIERLFLTFRERDEAELVATREIPVTPAFEAVDGFIDPELPPGQYRYWPCVGLAATTCEELPGGQAFEVIESGPTELIDGHNRRSADRINVLFVGSGIETLANSNDSIQLPDLARTLLAVGGPLRLDLDGQPFDGDGAAYLRWGPMAIEPLASNLDKFNFWYLTEEIADEQGILFSGFDEIGDAGFDLPNLHITVLYNDGIDFASDARGTSFDTFEPSEVPPSGRIRFGDTRVWISRFDPFGAANTLAHEWGHALFGLRDEYYGFDDRGTLVGFPNCAPDPETAEEWWGDLIGTADPFAEHVRVTEQELLEDMAFARHADIVDRTTIAIEPGGCYSDPESTEVYRPSVDSLMNSEVPVFGAVNRRRVEEVLDRFSGRGPMTSLDELIMTCEGLSGLVTCRGELPTFLDRPLSTVAVEAGPCDFGQGRPLVDGGIGPVPITCTMVGSPDVPVDLTFKGERRTFPVVDMNPPLPPVPLESRLIVDDVEDKAPESTTGRTVAIGALLIVAAIALGFVERRRRSSSDRSE